MVNWKNSVQYFKNERVLVRMLLDFEYLNEVANSKFGADTAHAKIIVKFVSYNGKNKKEYVEHVFSSCNVC